jgi:hypothetical protein
MINIFNAKAEKPIINVLFIQPTFYCGNNCKGCYSKAHKQVGPQVSIDVLASLIAGFYSESLGSCNQITISMDVLSKIKQFSHFMCNFNSGFTDALALNYLRQNLSHPEIHLTFRSAGEIQIQASYLNFTPDLITLSDIREHDLPWISSYKNRHKGTKFNYNFMTPYPLTKSSADQAIKHVKQVAQHVDSVYLVARKSPVGRERDIEDCISDISLMKNDLYLFSRIDKELNRDPKIKLDGCLVDIIDSKYTGCGCSANISRFQVWPDGSVSGCAYAKESDTPPADTVEGIVNNIRLASKTYDFRKCYLPSTYQSCLP